MTTETTITPSPDQVSPPNAGQVPSPSAAKPRWVKPEVTVLSIAANTHHAANTVSDGTGNLYS